jgi:hypothetical protein
MHDPFKLIRGLQTGINFLRSMDAIDGGRYPLATVTIKNIQDAIDYLDCCDGHETPVPCPFCGGTPCIVEDGEKLVFHVGCRQAFVSRAEGDDYCANHPSVMCVPSKKDAIDSWNSWVENYTDKVLAENKE